MPSSFLVAVFGTSLLFGAQLRVIDQLQRLVERGLVVAAVVRQHADTGVVRKIVGLDEVLAPHLGRIDPGGGRDQIADPLDHIGGFRTTGAPIGVDHRGVGVGRR